MFLFVFFLLGCAQKLRTSLYTNYSDIKIQNHCSYFPKGYATMASPNYPGILAIIDSNLVFDAIGAGSRPWMKHIRPFKINIKQVDSVNLSEPKVFDAKVISIYSNSFVLDFFMAKADTFYRELTQKVN